LLALSTLPKNWRQQFNLVDVQDAILAELTAREPLDRASQRRTGTGCIPMSWYSVRARLQPATVKPIADPGSCGVAARELAMPA
jgi:hypothetical protein